MTISVGVHDQASANTYVESMLFRQIMSSSILYLRHRVNRSRRSKRNHLFSIQRSRRAETLQHNFMMKEAVIKHRGSPMNVAEYDNIQAVTEKAQTRANPASFKDAIKLTIENPENL